MLPPTLVVFANPDASDRLRLDLEAKHFEDLRRAGGDVRVVHAASLDDLALALSEGACEILHFSGHGNRNALLFDHVADADGESVVAGRLVDLIRASRSPIQLVVLMACSSDGLTRRLTPLVPYVIGIRGDADDALAVRFARQFYTCLHQGRSVLDSFGMAKPLAVDRVAGPLRVTVHSAGGAERHLVHLEPGFHIRKSLIVDLSEIEDRVDQLGVSFEVLKELVSRKLRLHRWVFQYPRNRAILPVGHLFAEFSWVDPNGLVRCSDVFLPRQDVTDDELDTLVSFVVCYNDLYCSSYREPAVSGGDPALDAARLATALRDHEEFMDMVFSETAPSWRKVSHRSVVSHFLGSSMRISEISIKASLRICHTHLGRGQLGLAVADLETVLSTWHDLIDSLRDAIRSTPSTVAST